MKRTSYEGIEVVTNEVKRNIGWRIQEKRIERGMTGAELSAYLEVSSNQVSRIERGCAGVDVSKLFVICKILGVSADYILFGTDKRDDSVKISSKQYESICNLVEAFS